MRRSLTLAFAVLTLTACGGNDVDGEGASGGEERTVTIAAAASLGNAFEEIADTFESNHPGVTVQLQLAGSSDLASQITSGAEMDVFASADENNMDKVVEAVDGTPKIFATNVLTIITERGNPEGITGLDDLTDTDLAVVVCAPQVPCGTATEKLTQQEDVTLSPASEESQVTDVLAKVRSGEADAGLVYVTDATGAGDDVTMVKTTGADKVVNQYPIAALADAPESDLAREFVDLVTGPEGQKVLQEKGFGAP